MSIRAVLDTLTPVGGISQQPPHLRLQTQVGNAINVNFDVAFGASKRGGTVFDRKFTEAACADLRGRLFDYAADERYFIVYGRGASGPIFRAFRVGGNEVPVTISGAASTYLGLNSATSDQLRVKAIADYALVVNTTVATGFTASPSYSVERNLKDYDVVVGFSTTVGNRVRAESDTDKQPAGYFQYTPATYTYAQMNLTTVTNPWSIFNGYWDDASGGFITSPCGFRVSFQRVGLTGFTGATFTTATGTITKVGAFTGYTYRPGDMIYITAGTGFTANSWYKILSKTSNDAIVISGGPGADNANTGASDASTLCRIGIEVEVVVDFDKTVATDMADIAAEIQKQLRRTGATNACCVWVPGGVGGAFQITAPWRGNNAKIFPCTAPTSTLISANGDLSATGGGASFPRPFDGTNNYQIFNGTGGAAPDDSDTATPESRWTRVAAPSQIGAQPDLTKMPLKLTRTAANALSLDAGPWLPRTSGDATTNPGPTLIVNALTIGDLALFRDRVFLGGGPNISSTQSGSLFDLFQKNYANIVDSDPINRTLSARQIGKVEHLAPFRDALVIFAGGAGQSELSAPDALTPSTAAITSTARNRSTSTEPQPTNDGLYYITSRGQGAGLVEYHYSDIQVQVQVFSTVDHVPTLLPSAIRSLAVCPEAGTVFVLPTGSNGGSTAFMYYTRNDGNERTQVAWSRIVFDGGYRICDAVTIDTDLWMLVENTATVTASVASPTVITYPGHGLSTGNSVTIDNSTTTPTIDGVRVVTVINANTFTIPVNVTVAGSARLCTGGYVVERLPLDRQQATSGWAYPIHLDRRLTLTGSFAAGFTTWTLPNTPSVLSGSAQFSALGSTLNTIVLGPAFGASSGDVVSITNYGTTTVSVAGDYSAGSVVLGRFFEWTMDLTRPFVPDGQNRPDIASPLGVQTMRVSHLDTCGYSVTAVQSLRADRARAFTNGNVPTSGAFEAMLSGDVNGTNPVRHSITDSSPKPATIAGIQYEVEHAPSGVTAGRNNANG